MWKRICKDVAIDTVPNLAEQAKTQGFNLMCSFKDREMGDNLINLFPLVDLAYLPQGKDSEAYKTMYNFCLYQSE